MMDNLRWGVIGFGSFADVAMGPAITNTPGHTLFAITGRDRMRVDRFAKKYGVEHSFTSASDLVSTPDLDAVYVATPNNQHCEHTILAAEHGLHVLCEKPMAVSLEEARRMTESCTANGVKLMIGNMMRFNPCHRWVKHIIREGVLGSVTEAKATFEYHLSDEGSPWRLDPEVGGGGAIMDVGVHCIDLLRYLLGAEVTRVGAFVDTGSYPFPADISAIMMLMFDSGAFGTVSVSFINKHPLNRVEIRGTEGSLVSEGTLWRDSAGRVSVETSSSKQIYESSLKVPDPYRLQIEHFAGCIKNDTEPIISGSEGLKDLAVCLAAYKSHETESIVNPEY
jgi:1,5-anhydro-D-fructose reductase (1,5-anhydro-D-mannitol-forming)